MTLHSIGPRQRIKYIFFLPFPVGLLPGSSLASLPGYWLALLGRWPPVLLFTTPSKGECHRCVASRLIIVGDEAVAS